MATDVGTLQGKLELDMSGFNAAMNQATNLVRKFGQQLQGALGSAATQGFSAVNSSVQSLASELQSLTTNAQNLINALGALNTQLQGFLNTQQTSSTLGVNINNAATEAANMNQNLGGASRNANRTAQNTNKAASGANKAASNANKLANNLNQSANFAANIKRILEGIVVSQTFYRLLSIMKELVSGANDFMNYMDQSSIAFKYLLGSADDANGMLEALQDFAISSPLDMKGATSAARMLMTMGVEAKNTIGVLRVLTDAATVAGGDMEDTVNRLSLALGQMLQSGTVKAQEVRQLVNANIPVYEILQEELGLTSKQIANIGKEGINSATAVNAILRGLQKRFKGASEAMQQTLTGALSAAKDSFYVLYSIMMQGPFNAVRESVVKLSEALQYLARVARAYGPGGVFEAIVPEWLQPYIRNIIGAFIQLGYALKYAALCARDIFGASFVQLVQIFNLILPPITIFLNTLFQLIHYLLQTYPILRYVIAAFMTFSILTKIGAIVMWFWKVMGLGSICAHVAKWVGYLMRALAMLAAVMVAHPAVLVFTAIGAAALVATGAIQKLINKLKELFSMIGAKWAKMNKTINEPLNIGYNPNKILQPTSKKNQDNTDKYNKQLQAIAGSMEDVGDKADKAGKKLKQNFNQSFDEVYTINPSQDVANDLGVENLGNLDLSDAIGQLDDFNAALGDIGGFDFSGWDQNFMDAWDDMWGKIKSYLQSFGLGSLLAGLLTTLLTGNPWLGLATALAALFWPAIAEKLGLTKAQGQTILGAALGALIGGVIAKICKVGFLKGALWAGIGALIFAGLWPAIQEYMDSGDWRKAIQALNFTLFGAGIGALIGNLIGGPIGAGIGAVVGVLIGNGLEEAIDAWTNGAKASEIVSKISFTKIGLGIGTAIGAITGGPAGAAIGAGVGTLVGWITDKFVDGFANGNWDVTGISMGIGGGLGAAIGTIAGGPIGTVIGAAIGTLVGWIASKFIEADWGAVKDAFLTPFKTFGESVKEFWSVIWDPIKEAFESGDWLSIGANIVLGIIKGILGAIITVFGAIATFFKAVWDGFCEIFGIASPAKEMEPIGMYIILGIIEGIVNTVGAILAKIAEVGLAIIETIGSWFTDIGAKVTGWLSEAKTSVTSFITETGTSISTWVVNRITDFTTWATTTKNAVTTWVTETGTSIGTWISETSTSIGTWVSNRVNDFTNFVTNTATSISNWVTNTATNIGTWTTNTATKISNWVTTTSSNITSWVTNTITSIGNWLSNVKSKFATFFSISFTNWCSSTLNSISSWATSVWNTISNCIGNAINKIKEFLSLSNSSVKINADVSGYGHANGGVFNREHWARFAEGNKAEAIIPLENKSAMQPFVDAVSNGLTASLGPILANMRSGNNQSMQPLYVGTLIADERSLAELQRKLNVIQLQEEGRVF